MWRPKDWENPIGKTEHEAETLWKGEEYKLFEAGADAMLEAIKGEYHLELFALKYNDIPVILKNNQQILIGIKFEEGELPVYLAQFCSQGEGYILRSLIITGESLNER